MCYDFFLPDLKNRNLGIEESIMFIKVWGFNGHVGFELREVTKNKI